MDAPKEKDLDLLVHMPRGLNRFTINCPFPSIYVPTISLLMLFSTFQYHYTQSVPIRNSVIRNTCEILVLFKELRVKFLDIGNSELVMLRFKKCH